MIIDGKSKNGFSREIMILLTMIALKKTWLPKLEESIIKKSFFLLHEMKKAVICAVGPTYIQLLMILFYS